MNERYIISATESPFGEIADVARFDSAEEAIIKWCELTQIYPTCVSLQAQTDDDARALMQWAFLNDDKMKAYLSKYNVPYKANWFMGQIRSKLSNGGQLIQWGYDEVYPFCKG